MNSGPIKILLVEDNPGDARLLREILSEAQRSQFELDHAERLSDALRRLEERRSSIILLDLSLPDAQGLETIARVRRVSPSLPIVILTGLDDEEVAVKALQQGAQDYLIKGQVDGGLLIRSLRYSIERKRTEEQIEQQLQKITALRDINVAMTSSLDLRQVLQVLMEKINRLLNYPSVLIWLYNAATGQMERTACWNLDEQDWKARKMKALPLLVREAIESRAPVLAPDVQNDPRTLDTEFYRKHGLVSYLGVPLVVRDDVLGVLVFLTHRERLFTPEEIEYLSTLAGQAAMSIFNSQLYEQMKHQAAELEKANQMQADFAAMIAHDLRSPLMNITGAAEVMKDGMFGQVNDEQKKWLSKILANGRNLVDLVSDFLDVSKLEAGYVEVNKESVDLNQLMERSLENHLVLARTKNIALKWAVDASMPPIYADPGRLDQVLSNLISNAIKFTGEAGEIEIGAAPAGASESHIWVKDNGMGIPSDEIGQLFQKYRQCGNSKDAAQKGTGLGLVICKMIVEAHGGRIWVESTEGKGSTFTLALPIDNTVL